MLVTNISSPSLGNFATPAHLFFLLKNLVPPVSNPTQAKSFACFARALKNILSDVFLNARAMGADPTASPVTGECSTVELRPHEDKIAEILFFYNLFLVPMNGIEPFFEAYESPVLPLNYIGKY